MSNVSTEIFAEILIFLYSVILVYAVFSLGISFVYLSNGLDITEWSKATRAFYVLFSTIGYWFIRFS